MILNLVGIIIFVSKYSEKIESFFQVYISIFNSNAQAFYPKQRIWLGAKITLKYFSHLEKTKNFLRKQKISKFSAKIKFYMILSKQEEETENKKKTKPNKTNVKSGIESGSKLSCFQWNRMGASQTQEFHRVKPY